MNLSERKLRLIQFITESNDIHFLNNAEMMVKSITVRQELEAFERQFSKNAKNDIEKETPTRIFKDSDDKLFDDYLNANREFQKHEKELRKWIVDYRPKEFLLLLVLRQVESTQALHYRAIQMLEEQFVTVPTLGK